MKKRPPIKMAVVNEIRKLTLNRSYYNIFAIKKRHKTAGQSHLKDKKIVLRGKEFRRMSAAHVTEYLQAACPPL